MPSAVENAGKRAGAEDEEGCCCAAGDGPTADVVVNVAGANVSVLNLAPVEVPVLAPPGTNPVPLPPGGVATADALEPEEPLSTTLASGAAG